MYVVKKIVFEYTDTSLGRRIIKMNLEKSTDSLLYNKLLKFF